MEKAVRRPEQLSDHWQNPSLLSRYSPSQATDQDLLARIRSLLLSRNSHFPPETPCPSPDFTFSSYDVESKSIDHFRQNHTPSALNIDKFIAKLAQLGSEEHVMVVNPYEGPLGRLEETTGDRHRRRPSQPDLQDRSTDDTILKMDNTMDQKSVGNLMGRDPVEQSGIDIVSPKSPTGSRIPRYVLKTINTPSPSAVNDVIRPSPQHVPGSYRSEVDQIAGLDVDRENPSVGQGMTKEGNQLHPDLEYLHPKFDSLKSAFEALSIVRDHHPPPADPPSIRVDHALPNLVRKTSQSTLQSNLSAKSGRHPLLQPTADVSGAIRLAEPVLTPTLDNSHSNDEGYHFPEPAPTTPLKSEPEPFTVASKVPPNESNSTTTGEQQPWRASLGSDSAHVAQLLAELAPFSDDVMGRVISEQPAVTAGDHSVSGQQSVGSHSPSVYSRRSSLRFNAKGRSRKSSRSPRPRKKTTSSIYDDDTIGLLSEEPSEADAKSILSDKLSTFSRALSQLSEISLQQIMPSTTHATKDNTSDIENESFRIQKPPSVPSTVVSGTTSESNQPSSWQKGSYRRPMSVITMPGVANTDPKHSWVRQLLGRRSSDVVRPTSPILTARPQRKQIHAADGWRADMIPLLREFEATADGTRSQRRVTDSTDAMTGIRLQQTNPESFSQVIGELEILLKEALTIARQAADREEHDIHEDPMETGKPATGRQDHDIHDDPIEVTGQAAGRLEHDIHEDPTEVVSGDYQNHPHFTRRGGIHTSSQVSDSKSKQDKTQVTILEHEGMEHNGEFIKPRDPTPYPPGCSVQTRHASLTPGAELLNSITKHAKEVTAHLGVPKPVPTTEISNSETTVHFKKGRSSTMAQVTNEVSPWEDFSEIPKESPEIINFTLQRRLTPYPQAVELPPPQKPPSSRLGSKEQTIHLSRKSAISEAPSKEEVRDFIDAHHTPPIQPRSSSVKLRMGFIPEEGAYDHEMQALNSSDEDLAGDTYVTDFHLTGLRSRKTTRQWTGGEQSSLPGLGPGSLPQQDTINSLRAPRSVDNSLNRQEGVENTKGYSLRDRHHFSIRGAQGFSLSRSHRRAPIARDWSTRRKRFVAAVTCINTALLGFIIGIYAGEVPAIQYAIIDQHHYAILGNVVFFIGMAIPTILFFPLPLLHGRKPYTLGALALLLPLQFPQAIAVGQVASPYIANYRVGLLLPRAFAGFVAGFANINLITTLLDLFGASLQSGNPHQESVDVNDVRRHGGGMGVWLGIWTWCFIGSIGLGFLIGAGIISGLPVTWGFWISIILTAAVLVLNVMTPEVRRSPYRRSMAEVMNGTEVSRRIARGEVKMHLYSTGPKHWWEEVVAGHVLCIRMLKQPGFVVLSMYMGWIYGQVVMVIVLLGALTSRYYMFRPQYVGLCVSAIPIGALLAIPFQKASFFSRARHHAPRTDSMTFEKRVTWTTHLVRRGIFMVLLPFAGLAYTLASGGTQTHFIVPTLFAGVIGFLSNLAIAECHGIIMETFDTSDLQPGMTGRPRRILPQDVRKKRTNFSCFPRVTAAFAISQTFAFCLAAAATGTGGAIERALGAQAATGVVAGVLLFLTLLLMGVLTRFKTVQIVPSKRYGTNVLGGPEDEWKPVIIGHPSGTTRRVSILEMGEMTRWTEIRRRNRLMST
ncbi:hypothetical protein MMC30_003097 [Trapelia coarctata]|nr:hypothetical protein [Trapelia coarctata]